MPSLPRRRWIGTRSSVVATISDGGANPAHRPFRRLPPAILKPPLHCPQPVCFRAAPLQSIHLLPCRCARPDGPSVKLGAKWKDRAPAGSLLSLDCLMADDHYDIAPQLLHLNQPFSTESAVSRCSGWWCTFRRRDGSPEPVVLQVSCWGSWTGGVRDPARLCEESLGYCSVMPCSRGARRIAYTEKPHTPTAVVAPLCFGWRLSTTAPMYRSISTSVDQPCCILLKGKGSWRWGIYFLAIAYFFCKIVHSIFFFVSMDDKIGLDAFIRMFWWYNSKVDIFQRYETKFAFWLAADSYLIYQSLG